MKDSADKTFCTIDHSNKMGDAHDFNPYEFWLKQLKLREEIEAMVNKNGDTATVVRRKSQLT